MSNLERLGDSEAAERVFAAAAERRRGRGDSQSDASETARLSLVSKPPPGAAGTIELEMIDLSQVRTRPIDWLWRGYIPLRKVTILDGDPGLGKSTLMIDIAARGSIGGTAPTEEPLGDAFVTIYVTAEDDPEDTILPRVLRAGGDPSRFRLVRDLVLPADAGRLEAAAGSIRARLIVIDPLVAYLGDGVKTNDDHRVRRALEPLAAMAARTDAAVVAIRHLNKRAGEDAIYRGGGSIGFTGLARSVLAVGRDPDDEGRTILAAIKLNVARRPASLAYRIVADGPYEAAHIAWEGPSERTAEDLIGRTRDEVAGRSKTAELAHAIRELLGSNGGSMAAGDAYRALEAQGFDISSQDNLARARSQAGVRTAKQGYNGGWVWSLRTSVSRSVPSVPSEPLGSTSSKTPKSPTKTPKTPISRTREDGGFTTESTSPSPVEGTLWGEGTPTLPRTVSGGPKRVLEGGPR
jgi:hypothetical protein